MTIDLTGRAALVTGASSGLGRRFAVQLAQAGAAVVLAARRREQLDVAVAEIAASGGRALAVTMDVADEASVQQGFTAAETAFGPVEVVIANAGVAGSSASALKTDVEDFMGVFEVNLRGAFLTAREGARRMMAAGSAESGRGRIILIGSIRGLHATPGSIGYSASKSALHQMGLVMAREWVGRGVNVNILAPGYVETEMTTPWLQGDVGEAFVQAMPRRRLMAEADMDELLLFLSSDSSRAVTGSIFKIDDGQTLV